MEQSKEFHIEYSIWLPTARHGNLRAYGNPFDREDILTHIAFHASQQDQVPIDWSESLGVTYKISESARLLDDAWDNYHRGGASGEEMVELLEKHEKSNGLSKIEKMREMHRQNDG
jgi:hypothetical protein